MPETNLDPSTHSTALEARMQSRCGGIEDDMRIVAPGDAAPIAGKDAGGSLAPQAQLDCSGGIVVVAGRAGSRADGTSIGPPSTSGQARSCKQETGQPIRRARVRKVAAGPMQRASFAKPPRGAPSMRSREAISPATGARDRNIRSKKLSGAARKHAARDLSLVL